MLRLDLSNVAIISVKKKLIIHDISQSQAIHLLKNDVLDDPGYI